MDATIKFHGAQHHVFPYTFSLSNMVGIAVIKQLFFNFIQLTALIIHFYGRLSSMCMYFFCVCAVQMPTFHQVRSCSTQWKTVMAFSL